MGWFTKKKETIIESVNTKEVEGVKIWMVSWNSFYSTSSTSSYVDLVGHKRVAKAFLNLEDAKLFVKSLEDAQKLLQNDLIVDFKIEEQI